MHIPIILLGENSYIHTSDNLVLDHLILHLLKQTGHLFCIDPTHTIDNLINGIPVSSFHMSFDMINLFYYILPSFWAYVVNSIVVKAIGFTGAYLCSKDIIKNKYLIFLLALFYATIPTYTIYGISITGLPLLFYSFKNLSLGRKTILSYLLIALYAFYSHFFLVGPFIISAIFIYGLYYRKSFQSTFWIGLFCLTFTSIILNFGFLFNYLFGETPHRIEYDVYTNYSFTSSSLKTIFLIVFGHLHFGKIFILPILFLTIINKKLKEFSPYFFVVICFSFFAGYYEFLLKLLENYITRPFDVSRYIILVPLALFLGLIKVVHDTKNIYLTYLLLLVQILSNMSVDEDFSKNYFSTNAREKWASFVNENIIIPINNNVKFYPLKIINDLGFFGADQEKEKWNDKIIPQSYNSFYCPSLFNSISNYIGKDQASYRTLNLGFHPAVSQYNGFYTLDIYSNYYPLRYKHAFRKIIDKELEKNRGMKKYFDTRANTCYILSSELASSCGYNCTKYITPRPKVENLNLNTSQIVEMGGQYVLSSVEVLNAPFNNLEFIRVFKSPDCDYNIYLYLVCG